VSEPESRWPGERLGLPAEGPRSIARLGRRVAALFIDWMKQEALDERTPMPAIPAELLGR
jgi:hypothetical protein